MRSVLVGHDGDRLGSHSDMRLVETSAKGERPFQFMGLRKKICTVCTAEFETTVGSAKFCPDCRKTRKAERQVSRG